MSNQLSEFLALVRPDLKLSEDALGVLKIFDEWLVEMGYCDVTKEW